MHRGVQRISHSVVSKGHIRPCILPGVWGEAGGRGVGTMHALLWLAWVPPACLCGGMCNRQEFRDAGSPSARHPETVKC